MKKKFEELQKEFWEADNLFGIDIKKANTYLSKSFPIAMCLFILSSLTLFFMMNMYNLLIIVTSLIYLIYVIIKTDKHLSSSKKHLKALNSILDEMQKLV